MVKPGAAVVDVGVNRAPDPTARGGFRLVGDVDFGASTADCREDHPEPRRRGANDHRHADAKHRPRRGTRNGKELICQRPDKAQNLTMQAARILPDLQCSLLCEEIRQEANGNFFIIGVINFIRVPQVPVTALKLSIFNRWTAGVGQFTEAVRLVPGPAYGDAQERGQI